MCGIAGFMGRGDRNDVKQMAVSLKHRGPDDQGIFFQEGIGLAHTRLSIIDVSPAGHQPMSNDDATVWIVFNGEIYNFLGLRRELDQTGKYKFKSESDTEVILRLYEEFGEKCFEKMNGMFAIAIYDRKSSRLILARDRMGEKPLYWGIFGKTIIFGSELKSLMAHQSFYKEIDLESLNKYLAYEYVPTPRSIFKNVYKLEPASYLIFENGKIKKESFWKMIFAPAEILFTDAMVQLEKEIESSVKMRLVSDVPLGVFLSGGIDSSTMAYYASKSSSGKIKTFSIGFEDKSFDESIYAKKVSDFLGTDHHLQIVKSKDMLEFIPRMASILDEPLADASIVPTFLLSQFAKRYVTVALGGDGGDELFAGYSTFQAQKLASLYEVFPRAIRNGIREIIERLPVSDKYFSLEFQLKKFIEGFEGKKEYRHQRWLGSFNREEREQLFTEAVWEKLISADEYTELNDYIAETKTYDRNNQMLYLYLKTYLMDDVLVKVDRASMANALEVRTPLLDHHIVDFVNSLPYAYKNKGFTSKYLLKKLMADKLPKEIVYRSKKGFGIPLGRWLKNDLRCLCDSVLSESAVKKGGFFNVAYVNKLKDEHFEGRRDNRKKIWTLMAFDLWQQRWLPHGF